MFEIKSSGDYWIDSDGNMWSMFTYSKKDALRLSKTLKDCKGCIDCSYCDDCMQCEDCHYCHKCECSTKCKFCTGCVQCSRCYHCICCSYCYCCNRCDDCYCCTDVIALSYCKKCDDIENTISGLNKYRRALNYTVIDTGAGKVTILVDNYHNLWYQLGDETQTDWECFVSAFKLNSERATGDSDTVKSELEYIKSIGEFFHKTIKKGDKENDCKNYSSDDAPASGC